MLSILCICRQRLLLSDRTGPGAEQGQCSQSLSSGSWRNKSWLSILRCWRSRTRTRLYMRHRVETSSWCVWSLREDNRSYSSQTAWASTSSTRILLRTWKEILTWNPRACLYCNRRRLNRPFDMPYWPPALVVATSNLPRYYKSIVAIVEPYFD
ncbi:hypothetical protein LX36DRAFT_278232 [Colletotrichum falcatum]|nr:hypothetical protein LX36DRAFT_278232 [Colletotrichum falcatum]